MQQHLKIRVLVLPSNHSTSLLGWCYKIPQYPRELQQNTWQHKHSRVEQGKHTAHHQQTADPHASTSSLTHSLTPSLPHNIQQQKLTVHFFKHPKHCFQEIMIQKPHIWLLEVLLEGNAKTVSDVHSVSGLLAE